MIKIFLLQLLFPSILFSGICFAEVCPSSNKQVMQGRWASKFEGRVANFNRFEGVVYRNNQMFCAYKDKFRPPNLAVFGSKSGYQKPNYRSNRLWRIHKHGIICTRSIAKCHFSRK